MKQLLILFIITLSAFVEAQETTLGEITTCQSGTKRAITDFTKGHYEVYSFGLMISFDDYGFGEYYKNYVFEKYNVKLTHMGCVINSDTKCYSDKMEELLYVLYGDDMYEIAEEESKKKFKLSENFKEIRRKIDSEEVFFFVHDNPEFIGGEEALERFLGRSINIDENLDWEDYLRVYFTVEKNGAITDVVLKDNVSNEVYKGKKADELIKKLKNMPKWKPAMHYGEVVRNSHSITVTK